MPAGLYCAYNNLVYVNNGHFDPGTYNVLMQFRLVRAARPPSEIGHRRRPHLVDGKGDEPAERADRAAKHAEQLQHELEQLEQENGCARERALATEQTLRARVAELEQLALKNLDAPSHASHAARWCERPSAMDAVGGRLSDCWPSSL